MRRRLTSARSVTLAIDEEDHRRLVRYAKTLSSESSVGATSKSETAASRATRATIAREAAELGDADGEQPVVELRANTAGSARNAAASRRLSEERTTNVCGRSVISRRIWR